MKRINQARGCYPQTEMFFHTSSAHAKKQFYYLDVCGHAFASPQYYRERQTYNDYILIYVLNGQLEIENEGIPGTVHAGQVVLMNCHLPHIYYSKVDTEMWYVHFDHKDMHSLYEYIGDTVGLISSIKDDSLVLEPLKMLVSHCKYSKQVSEARISQLIYQILTNLIYANESGDLMSRHDNHLINQTLEYIHEHYTENISLEQLALISNVSSYHLSHLFKKYTQQSPYEYLILTRLDEAKRLLSGTDKPISEIAYAVGYSSDTGFINAFTKKIGISPRKFRMQT